MRERDHLVEDPVAVATRGCPSHVFLTREPIGPLYRYSPLGKTRPVVRTERQGGE